MWEGGSRGPFALVVVVAMHAEQVHVRRAGHQVDEVADDSSTYSEYHLDDESEG